MFLAEKATFVILRNLTILRYVHVTYIDTFLRKRNHYFNEKMQSKD